MREIELKVSGMMCEGCENRVKNALKQIDGVQEVFANHIDGIVKVESNDKIDKNTIKEAIEDIGYEVMEGK